MRQVAQQLKPQQDPTREGIARPGRPVVRLHDKKYHLTIGQRDSNSTDVSDSAFIGGQLSVDVAAPVDVNDLYASFVLDDRVDDSVVAAASRSQAGKLIAERFADAGRVPGERTEDELDAGRSDLLW